MHCEMTVMMECASFGGVTSVTLRRAAADMLVFGLKSRRLVAHVCAGAALLSLAGCALMQPTPVVPTAASQPDRSSVVQARAAALYRDGLRVLNPPSGSLRDPVRSAQLIEEAANLGHPEAQFMVAMGHLAQPDGGRDPQAAIGWLLRAAQQGHAEAQFRLARMIEAGDGTLREPAWAAVWYHRAAERGVPEAQFAMSLLQIAGIGTAVDQSEALARLQLAERGGVQAATRYRTALQRLAPPAEAAAALARLQRESVRGPVTAIDRPLVRFMQSGLATLGLSPNGAIVDGRDGPLTRTTIATFCSREGLRGVGPYDAQVIGRLRERLARAD